MSWSSKAGKTNILSFNEFLLSICCEAFFEMLEKQSKQNGVKASILRKLHFRKGKTSKTKFVK